MNMESVSWDPLRIEYPVRKFPNTGESSTTIGHRWRGQPDVLKTLKEPIRELKEYSRDYCVTKDLMTSQTTLDFGPKTPETRRFNKHTSFTENQYNYPPYKKISDHPNQCRVHGTTEMKEKFSISSAPARLITDKNQYKPACFPWELRDLEPDDDDYDLKPLDTTHESYQKYLDPYLTTSRLHHRPFTADQLKRPSVNKEIATYYTFANSTIWTRTPKPKIVEWRLPTPSCSPKSINDREKFALDRREIRTHNKLTCVPGAFRTECRDNYKPPKLDSQIKTGEQEIRSFYKHALSNLPPNEDVEHFAIKALYKTEAATFGSGKSVGAVLDQFREKNKRLQRKLHKT